MRTAPLACFAVFVLFVLGCGSAPPPDRDGGDPAELGGGPPPGDLAHPPLPAGVFLYTGAGGGGPSLDLNVGAVQSLYETAGIAVARGDTLPASFDEQFGVLEVLNPRMAIPAEVQQAAQRLVAHGGRLVVVMEHCKDGCWGNAGEDNRLLGAVGSSMTLVGTGGAPLAKTTLELTSVPPLTDGVSRLVAYYSGSATVGKGVALGRMSGGDVIVGYEQVGAGEVVIVADSDPFGHQMDQGDNRAFVLNLGRL